MKEIKLVKRNDVNGLDGYYHYDAPNGRRYSVVDFSTTMKTHPFPEGIYKGWEAMRIDDSHGEDDLIRADSWEELQKML